MATIAKNNQKSIEQYTFRKYYDVVYYPKEYTNIIDFWKNSILYGKVNRDLDSIILNTNNLKVLKTSNINQANQFYVMSFVADAFNEMVVEFQRADQLSLIPKSKLNPLKIVRATIIPQNNYNETIRLFLDTSFDQNKLRNKITNLNDFLNEFSFVMSSTSLYVSQTSFVMNNVASPTITGLVIDLSNLDNGDDQQKVSQYLNDPNYQFFINTAEKYSFFVDKNAPWRLVFNLSTNYALEKIKQNNFNSIDEMFANAYTTTYTTDWKVIKDTLIQYYNDKVFVKTKLQSPVLNDEGHIVSQTINKQIINNNTYNDLFWIKMYYYVRLREEDIRINQNQFENKLVRLTSIYNSSGEKSALEYINKDTKPFLDGGTNPSYDQVIEVNKKKKMKSSNFIYKF
jgi:hypothetical protein